MTFSLILLKIAFFSLASEQNNNIPKDIFNIDEKKFEELREAYKERPKPKNLDFDEKNVEKYIASLPENLRDGERERFNIIKGTKDQIYRLFERNSMEIKDSIKLTSGKSIRGTIAMANENGFIVRKGSRKGKTYKWDDLSFQGYTEILEYFAEKRLKVKVANISEEENKKYAANDYILLTLLCDWYGEYAGSIKYAQKAVNIRPDIKDKLNELLFK